MDPKLLDTVKAHAAGKRKARAAASDDEMSPRDIADKEVHDGAAKDKKTVNEWLDDDDDDDDDDALGAPLQKATSTQGATLATVRSFAPGGGSARSKASSP